MKSNPLGIEFYKSIRFFFSCAFDLSKRNLRID